MSDTISVFSVMLMLLCSVPQAVAHRRWKKVVLAQMSYITTVNHLYYAKHAHAPPYSILTLIISW